MTITTTTFTGVFDEQLYRDLNARAAGYMMENPQISWVPVHQTPVLNAYQYKKPIYGASIGIRGSHHIGLAERRMETPKSHKVYDLEVCEGNITYDMNDMTMEGAYLAQEKSQELNTWLDQCIQSYFKGVFTGGFSEAGLGQGARLNTGFIEQATLVENLDGTNSALIAAGDVYKALNKMVSSIPFRFREGRQVIIGCDDLFRRQARTALFRGATNQISEFDLFFQELAQEMPPADPTQVSRPVIVSDKLFLNLVAGTTKTETDTIGTHSRLMSAVVDPEILEAVYSFNGLMGEQEVGTIRGVEQKWVQRLAGCVHQPTAVCYSEQITWA